MARRRRLLNPVTGKSYTIKVPAAKRVLRLWRPHKKRTRRSLWEIVFG